MITVGLPTYNRAERLERAIGCVLDQTHADLELLISDNASTDGTQAVGEAAAARDDRVRYVRQPENLGLTGNFNWLFEHARGDHVMVLADDDWLEPNYLARCLAALDADPGLTLACGSARYYAGEDYIYEGRTVDLPDDDPAARIRRYYGDVDDNVAIYGLIRREALDRALPMRNCLAGDWLLIARIAMQGRVRTLRDTSVHRALRGTSVDFPRQVRTMGLTPFEARHPHLAMARFACEDVLTHPVYDDLPAGERRRLALGVAWDVVRTHPRNVIEDEIGPTLRRPRLRWLDRTLRRVSQATQSPQDRRSSAARSGGSASS